jgi:uncharacterized protein involved in response to NO
VLFNIIHFYFRFLGNLTAHSLHGLFVFILSLMCLLDFIHHRRKNDIFIVCLIITYFIVAAQIAMSWIEHGPLLASLSLAGG